MSEPITWDVQERAKEPVRTERVHRAAVEEMPIEVKEDEFGTAWTVRGYLDEMRVEAYDYTGSRRPVEQAREEVEAAARRLLAAGITAQPRYRVSCCEVRYLTRDAADQHEAIHVEERARVAGASEHIPSFEEVFGPAPEFEDDEIRVGRLPRDDEETR